MKYRYYKNEIRLIGKDTGWGGYDQTICLYLRYNQALNTIEQCIRTTNGLVWLYFPDNHETSILDNKDCKEISEEQFKLEVLL